MKNGKQAKGKQAKIEEQPFFSGKGSEEGRVSSMPGKEMINSLSGQNSTLAAVRMSARSANGRTVLKKEPADRPKREYR